MAILFGSTYTAWDRNGSSSYDLLASNLSVTCANSNSFLLAFGFADVYAAGSNASITWKANSTASLQSFTQIQRVSNNKGNYRIWAWYLPNPIANTTGGGNITAKTSTTAVGTHFQVYVMEVFGANLANSTYIYNVSNSTNTTGGYITTSISAGIGSKMMFAASGSTVATHTTSAVEIASNTTLGQTAYVYRAKGIGGTYSFSITPSSGSGIGVIQFAIDGVPDTGGQASFLQMF